MVIYIRRAPRPGLRVCKENWMSRTGVKGSINPQTFLSFPEPCHNVQASPVFWVKRKSNHFLTTFAFVTLIQDTIISQVDYYNSLQTGISTFSFISCGKCHRSAHLIPSQTQLHQVKLDRVWKPSLHFLNYCPDGLNSTNRSFFQADKQHSWDLEGEMRCSPYFFCGFCFLLVSMGS